MDVIIHLLVPCVKDLNDAGNSTKILFICRKLQERFGAASVKQGIQKLLIAVDQRIELMRQRKDDMEVRRIDHLRPAFINPDLFCDSLTVWTVPVPAGVIVNRDMAAFKAVIYVVAKLSGFTPDDSHGSFFLDTGQMIT